jgi:two-component system response regulator FlrC
MNSISEDYPFAFVDPKSVELFNLATKVARADIPVMITGPSGVGKEVLARVIHETSNRSDKPFIAINCAAIPEQLVESTLFGHERGAFTGANGRSKGFFEEANFGTMFLDEIGEMPTNLQSKMLRVLQEKEIYRIGATKALPIDIRIISATNINISEYIDKKYFREDLYYRLSGFVLEIKKLNERVLDIEPLARIFIQKHSNGERIDLSRNALEKLKHHSWPGNVRELENVIFRSLILRDDYVIEDKHIVFDQNTQYQKDNISESIEKYRNTNNDSLSFSNRNDEKHELNIILSALKESENRLEAANRLGISTRTLRLKLQNFRDLGFQVPQTYARKV